MSATTIQTVGAKGYDGFTLALVAECARRRCSRASAAESAASRMPSAEARMFAAVRWASDMIEIIGFTPGAVGKAEASPIHTPGVSCSCAAPVGDRLGGIRAHPAGAHLVRA